MLAAANPPAQLRRLVEREPETRGIPLRPERDHIEPAIRLLGDQINGKLRGPGTTPGDDPALQLRDDASCDDVVD